MAWWQDLKAGTRRLVDKISREIHLSDRIKLLVYQILSVSCLAVPQAIQMHLAWTLFLLVCGCGFQYLINRLTTSHLRTHAFFESQLKKALNETDQRLEEVEKTEHYKSKMRDCLRSIMEDLGLHYASVWRVSLYTKEESRDEGFHLIARYSDNPDHENERTVYRDTGVIGKTWRENECRTPVFADPHDNLGTWKDQQQQHAFVHNLELLDEIGMRSRHYYGTVIRDHARDRKLAVLVFESTGSRAMTSDRVQYVLKSGFGWFLSEYLQRHRIRIQHGDTETRRSEEAGQEKKY